MRNTAKLTGLFFLGTLLAGCRTPPSQARYRPYENILEILSEFHRHAGDDLYRFPQPQDVTGQNLARATLRRIENFASLHPGRMEDIVDFSSAQARERMGDYEGALDRYRRVKRDSPLREKAQENAEILARLVRVLTFSTEKRDMEDYFEETEVRMDGLREIIEEARGTPYEAMARMEEERLEMGLVDFVVLNRDLIDNGTETALRMFDYLATKHAESKNANLHLLRFADFYAKLARGYARQRNPASPRFDMKRFEELAEPALRLYAVVSKRDGTIEKIEAQGKRKAFSAYIERVRREGS